MVRRSRLPFAEQEGRDVLLAAAGAGLDGMNSSRIVQDRGGAAKPEDELWGANGHRINDEHLLQGEQLPSTWRSLRGVAGTTTDAVWRSADDASARCTNPPDGRPTPVEERLAEEDAARCPDEAYCSFSVEAEVHGGGDRDAAALDAVGRSVGRRHGAPRLTPLWARPLLGRRPPRPIWRPDHSGAPREGTSVEDASLRGPGVARLKGRRCGGPSLGTDGRPENGRARWWRRCRLMPRRGTRSEERGSGGGPDGVVLVADPGAPLALARHVQDRLPWDVSVACRRLPADDLDRIRVPDDVPVYEGQVAVLLTDHPRRHGLRPVVAEVEVDTATALVSLPSLGAIRFRERATHAVERVVGELCGETGGAVGPFVREDGPPVRFVTGGRHGRLRMVAGMVRANRPWRLVPHLSKAFAAALAVLAYEMLNQTIWQLGARLGVGRLALAAVLAIATLVAWLIIDHQMWERPDDQEQRDLAVMFNVTTVTTLLTGVLFLYVGLVLIGFVVDLVLVDSGLVSSVTREPVTLAHRASLLWLVASIATVGGALGTGFESDEAVRQAAYGFRQRERLERDAPRRRGQDR